jgi:branched-chain amino acid transport system permease protein
MSVLTSGEFWAFVGVVAGIYTLFTLGLQVQFGLAGLLNFGQVGFMAIGAYTMAILVAKEGWSMWVATPVAIAAAALAGVLVGLPTLRLRGDYFAIVTIAFSEIVRWVATNENGLTGGAQGTINLAGQGTAAQYNGQWERFQRWVGAQLHVGDKDVVMLILVWTAALLLVWLTARLARTPWGRVLRAIREDEDATASLGKHVLAYRLQALALGAALAGLAGCVYAWQFSFFSPDDYQPLITFFGWMILILGGVGRVWAVPVGALVFGFLFAATRFFDFAPFSYLDSADRAYVRLMLIGLVIILLVVFRPQGLLGTAGRDGARVSALLEVRGVSKAFAGIRAVDDASLVRRGRLDHGAHRAERRREVDALQLHLRLRASRRGQDRALRPAHRPAAAAPDRAGRPRPDVPDRPRADADDGARQRAPRSPGHTPASASGASSHAAAASRRRELEVTEQAHELLRLGPARRACGTPSRERSPAASASCSTWHAS